MDTMRGPNGVGLKRTKRCSSARPCSVGNTVFSFNPFIYSREDFFMCKLYFQDLLVQTFGYAMWFVALAVIMWAVQKITKAWVKGGLLGFITLLSSRDVRFVVEIPLLATGLMALALPEHRNDWALLAAAFTVGVMVQAFLWYQVGLKDKLARKPEGQVQN